MLRKGYFLCFWIETMCYAVWICLQAMEGLPEITLPSIFSYLKGKDLYKCGCISKSWEHFFQQKIGEMEKQAAIARAQVNVQSL